MGTNIKRGEIMKRQIRKSVFETNSSSTHAICISKNSNYKKRDYIEFEIGEFGWEFEKYSNVHSKASYLITAIYDRNKEYTDEKLALLKELLERNNIEYEMPDPEIGSFEYYEKTEYYYNINGYIDHAGATEEFVNAVLSDDETFMRYMFGDSFILTGNDNSDCDLELPLEDDYEIYEKWN